MTTDTTPAPIALSREELIAMAREADPFGDDGRLVSLAMLTPGTLERFAAVVASAPAQADDAYDMADAMLKARAKGDAG